MVTSPSNTSQKLLKHYLLQQIRRLKQSSTWSCRKL